MNKNILKWIKYRLKKLLTNKPVWIEFSKDNKSTLLIYSSMHREGKNALLFLEPVKQQVMGNKVENNDSIYDSINKSSAILVFYEKAGVDKFIKLLEEIKGGLQK